jgi:hypothetical protein
VALVALVADRPGAAAARPAVARPAATRPAARKAVCTAKKLGSMLPA